MKKKLLAILLVVALVASLAVGFAACGKKGSGSSEDVEIILPAYDDEYADVDFSNVKIGLICLHDENSTYDKNFISAMEAFQAEKGIKEVIIATNIPEGDECYQKACELAEDGCDIIFADSFGHEAYMMKAAEKYTNVQFCHATGTKAHTSTLSNYANAFASIYEGRFLAGVAAGLKLVELYGDANGKVSDTNAKIGYVGAYTYAEVISGYSSFYLGVKSIVSNVTMEVSFTGSWYDETAENNAAKQLISRGAKLISQHADSMGAPNACEEANIPNVSYNGSTAAACPNTFIVSSRINWAPYYKYATAQVIRGEAVAKDWTGTIETGSVELSNLGKKAAADGTLKKLLKVRKDIVDGKINIFDTTTFTVGGNPVPTYKADVDDYGDYQGDTEAIVDGAFAESKFRSAPYFDLKIDGIKLLNTAFQDSNGKAIITPVE